jgi:hypothetical protein
LPWSVKKTVAPSALTATPAALVNLALPTGPDARPVGPPANVDTEHAAAPRVGVAVGEADDDGETDGVGDGDGVCVIDGLAEGAALLAGSATP